jgi:hypothetical protein
MSADKYYLVLSDDKATDKNSIFALTMGTNNGENISGEIYYFNKSEAADKKILKLSKFNDKENKIHIIVYNGRDLAYYKPPKSKDIDDDKLLDKLNSYDKCIIINITVKEYVNTYIFLREEQTKQDPDGIFEEMKKENEETFKKYNLINIVKALFNIIEDYHINYDNMQKGEPASPTQVEQIGDEAEKNKQDNILLPPGRHNIYKGGGSGKRKYKANVNQKSLKKMSTIIKKLLKINLNIKPAAKPKAKQAAKPKAKQAAKPKAKQAAKPKAKQAAKPKAKPATKPKAKQATKQAAKPKAKQAAKPKAKPATKPKAKSQKINLTD